MLDDVVRVVLNRDNECPRQMAAILRGEQPSIAEANAKCRVADALPNRDRRNPQTP